MEMTALLAYALAIATLAIKPGPGVVAVMSRTAARGMAGFGSYMSGALLGEVFYLAVVFFSFSFFQENMVFISILLKALASVYLIYLGVQSLNKASEVTPLEQEFSKGEDNWKDFTTGLMLTLSNPFVIIVFGGIIPTLFTVQNADLSVFFVLVFVTVIIQLSIDFFYCIPVLLSRNFLSAKILRYFTIGAGVMMILIGLYLGYAALPAADLKAVFFK